MPPVADHDPKQLFLDALRIADVTIARRMETMAPPKPKKKGDVIVHRFPNRDLDTFLLLKLVQLTSNLRGGKELLERGFTYEWSILHRVIDEAVQHTLFLLTADRKSQWERKHDDVLTAFFQDDVTRKGTVSTQPPKHVSATDIHSALQMAIEESDNIPPEFLGRAAPTLKSLRKIKSGFVHGRAASIMSLHEPETDSFLTNGGCLDQDIALQNLWRATYSALGGCVALSSLKWFGEGYYQVVAQFAEQFANAAKIGVTFDRRALSRLA